MHKFNVWAPKPKSISVEVDGKKYDMDRGDRGWWSVEVATAGPGSEYGFRLDGGDLRPDPRSPWQPNGPNGLSRLVDHAGFQWTDQSWRAKPLSSAAIYELHLGAFTPQGTFRSAIDKLDHLVDLGVTHVELMPVNEFGGKWGWGYDGVDLYAPHHSYGEPDDLKALVDGLHAKGLAAVLDVVYNHLGPSGNYLPEFGPYFTKVYSTPWGSAVNLDQAGSHEVRRFFVDNALMWLEHYHFDGLRLDAVHALDDNSAMHFLEQLSTEVAGLSAHRGKQFFLIAESDLNDPRIVRSRDAHGFGIDAQWSDDFHHALHALLTGEATGYYRDFGAYEDLATALREAYVFSGDFSESRGHRHGRRIWGLSGHRFLAYSQTHDQAGNRALGERLCHLVSPGYAKIAAAFVLTSPFLPMLFMGEEFAASSPFQYFTQHEDYELGRKVSEGRRSEFERFGWNPENVPDPQAPETFARSKLCWDEVRSGIHAEMLDWYKQLIALRKRLLTLTDGRLDQVDVCFSEKECWFVVTRGELQVAVNLARTCRQVPVASNSEVLLASQPGIRLSGPGIELPAESVAILQSSE